MPATRAGMRYYSSSVQFPIWAINSEKNSVICFLKANQTGIKIGDKQQSERQNEGSTFAKTMTTKATTVRTIAYSTNPGPSFIFTSKVKIDC